MKIEIYPLTPKRWWDVEQLFGKQGACEGFWRLPLRHPGHPQLWPLLKTAQFTQKDCS